MSSGTFHLEGVDIPFDSDLAQRVLKELEHREMQQLKQAVRKQREAARLAGERVVPGDAHANMAVHPAFYHFWGQRYGYECWEDEEFVREMLRDNPELRVKTVRNNPTVAVSGWAPSTSRSRFHKKYDLK